MPPAGQSVDDLDVRDRRTVLHWYNFTCPFCYVGQHRNQILAEHGLNIVALPFSVRLNIPPHGIPAASHKGPLFAMLERRAQEAGLKLHWPARLPNIGRALAAAEWVRRYAASAFPQLQRDLFESHFVLGDDLGNPAVIDRQVAACGVDLDAMRAALADNSAAAAVKDSENMARRYRVRGTPAWVIADRLIVGLRPAAEFKRLAKLSNRSP